MIENIELKLDELYHIDLELIMYDEKEYFQQWDSPMFNYPYEPRKTIIESTKFVSMNQGNEDYILKKVNLKLKKSLTCLE